MCHSLQDVGSYSEEAINGRDDIQTGPDTSNDLELRRHLLGYFFLELSETSYVSRWL